MGETAQHFAARHAHNEIDAIRERHSFGQVHVPTAVSPARGSLDVPETALETEDASVTGSCGSSGSSLVQGKMRLWGVKLTCVKQKLILRAFLLKAGFEYTKHAWRAVPSADFRLTLREPQ
eukprot:4097553-Amphidinium_carterae.1